MTSILTDPVGDLLASGGDSRQVVDPATGRIRYGCTFEPEPGLVDFGSCTASSTSPAGWAAAERVAAWIRAIDEPFLGDAVDDMHATIRHQLGALLIDRRTPPVEIVLSPSGTDAELVALAVFASLSDRKVVNIVVGASEVGSGTALAAAGLHFDRCLPNGGEAEPGTPVDGALAARTSVQHVGLRDGNGGERDDGDLDQEVIALVDAAVAGGARVLVHVVAHSKTGVHAPTLGTVEGLVARHGDAVGVVIDAAQGRFSRRGLNESLRAGRMVILTGSKFFGGPPFSGALLVPAAQVPAEGFAFPEGFGQYLTAPQLPRSWLSARAGLPVEANLGLLLRWQAAIAEMQTYFAVPSRLRLEVLRAFEAMVPGIWAGSGSSHINAVSPPLLENETRRLLESKTTVFPFSMTVGGRPLGFAELGAVHRWMREDLTSRVPGATGAERAALGTPVQLGQPVRIGTGEEGAAVLRVAISAPRITSSCVGMESGASFADRLGVLRRDLEATMTKLDLVACHYDTLAAVT